MAKKERKIINTTAPVTPNCSANMTVVFTKQVEG